MRFIISMLLLALLGVPALQEEALTVPVDAFIEKAGVEADDALRDKVADFLRERSLTERIVGMMDPALVRRYADHLSADLPISYDDLLNEPAAEMPGDVDFSTLKQLAVLHPEGAATMSLLADFERGLIYYDSAWPVPEDVCRASFAAGLTEDAAAALVDILQSAGLADWASDYPGDAGAGVNLLALRFDTGVVRYTAAALSEAPEAYMDTLYKLLSVGAEADGAQ